MTRSKNNCDTTNSACWRVRALIDTTALCHNLALVRKLAPDCKVMAVVKANAYGHGMVCITHHIAELVDAFAVATLQEGIECRMANPTLPITVLSGLHHSATAAHATALEVYQRYRLDPVVYTFEHIEWLAQSQDAPRTLWLKIDTGMSRLGIAPAQVPEAVARLRANRCIKQIRLMSHLANADASENDFTDKQLAQFQQSTAQYELERSLANSAAILNWPQTHFQWVRPGLMLYGCSPLGDGSAALPNLKPVMQLESRLLTVKNIAAGQSVGYGSAFIATVPMRIGLVGLGYGDGYPYSISPSAAVLIGNTRARIIGRVAMDMLTVDLTHHPQAKSGSTVVLWGNLLPVAEVAKWAATIPYELLCKVTMRVPRIPGSAHSA